MPYSAPYSAPQVMPAFAAPMYNYPGDAAKDHSKKTRGVKPVKHGGFWSMCTDMCSATSVHDVKGKKFAVGQKVRITNTHSNPDDEANYGRVTEVHPGHVTFNFSGWRTPRRTLDQHEIVESY